MPKFNSLIRQINQYRTQKPLVFFSILSLCGCILYYGLVIFPLQNQTLNLLTNIQQTKHELTEIIIQGQELMRLRNNREVHAYIAKEEMFAVLNSRLETQPWNKSVTNVHQLDDQQVQVNIQNIKFTELFTWLEDLYTKYGIYIADANLHKLEPGKVETTLLFSV